MICVAFGWLASHQMQILPEAILQGWIMLPLHIPIVHSLSVDDLVHVFYASWPFEPMSQLVEHPR